ncbi:MAG: aminotransferase class I/II-fold pyridoxal phosphate-dependent enzyme, partial [Alistipes sp.]|nr:aminotransferase class I/II-fold pyridoxal phosphate-dependent enzyme [Alistipes sp.]
METLYNKLDQYAGEDHIPFHMPGHKRNAEKFGMGGELARDITEIDGFDDLHQPRGILRQIEEKASEIYGTKNSFYLVNGSSGGILTAVSAAKGLDKKIVMARNSHKSVYNGVSINHLTPYYIYPEVLDYGIMGEITAEQVEQALTETGAGVVLITSPTYEGVVSDVEKIARICHEKNAVFIVDEAHGAHFAFHADFPKNAVECGADIVIESLHKTLPCYTQTAILHVNSERISPEKIKRYYSIYQTSSPSYLFMAGMDQCIDYMVSGKGKKENQIYIEEVKKLREKLKTLKNIKLFDGKTFDYDFSKIVLCCRGRGAYLYEELLRGYHIQLEMAAADYVIAMTSIGDKAEWYGKFYDALAEIDNKLYDQSYISSV